MSWMKNRKTASNIFNQQQSLAPVFQKQFIFAHVILFLCIKNGHFFVR